MITKINAELDSIETAELAARMIKQKTNGIINIKIDSKSNIKTVDDSSNFFIPFFPVQNDAVNNQSFNTAASIGGFVNLNYQNDNYDSREISRAVVIDVICNKESENIVTQVFTSLGGLKINKN